MTGGPVSKGRRIAGTSVILPTTLQMADDILKYWTSLTCLYDRYWQASDSEKTTLPICVFHVTKITPVYTVEVSKKRIILYEPIQHNRQTVRDMASPLRENVMRSVIDNSVKMPTVYNVEAIVPFQPMGRYIRQGVKTIADMITDFAQSQDLDTAGVRDIISGANNILNLVETGIRAIDRLPLLDGITYVNMNSLEAMAASCRLLCMKMWTGYEYKFAEITGLTFEKHGKEDGVFRASFTLQERPVLSISRPRSQGVNRLARIRGAASAVIGWAAEQKVRPITALTGVRGSDAADSDSRGTRLIDILRGG